MNDLQRNEFEQSEFERQVERAMQRVEAPTGFTDRLMARAQNETQQPAKVFVVPWRTSKAALSFKAWTGGAIAATLALGALVGGQQYQHRQRERAADQQFETATRITDKALEHTREQLERAGIPLQ